MKNLVKRVHKMFKNIFSTFVDARSKSVISHILRDYGYMLNEETKQRLRESYTLHNK